MTIRSPVKIGPIRGTARLALAALLLLLGAGGLYWAWSHRDRREEPPRARLVQVEVGPRRWR